MTKTVSRPDREPPERRLVSEAHLAGILQIAEDAIISLDAQQRITLFNRGAGEIFGYDADEVIGRQVDILLPENFRHLHHAQVDDFAAGPEQARMMGSRRRIWGRRKSGEVFPAEASISKLEAGGELVMTVILRDRTEQLRAEELLEQQVRERSAHLNSILSFSTELIGAHRLDEALELGLRHGLEIVHDADRGALYIGEAGKDALTLGVSAGFDRPPPLNLPLPEHYDETGFAVVAAGLGHQRELVVEPLQSGREQLGALLIWRPAGAAPLGRDVRLTLDGLANLLVTAIQEERGRAAAASMASELANLQAREQQVQQRLDAVEAGMLQAARLAAVGQLAASVAHEINNPLYAVRNSLFLLEEDLPAPQRDSPYLKLASEQLERIARIIERMREFYRPQHGELAPQDLNAILEATLALASLDLRYRTIRMVFAPAADLPSIIADGDQLRQVFLNLVLNAIEAMPDGGSLTVRTRRAGPAVLAEVEDTGAGIAEDVRARLFEPFYTTKPTGTGLGLAISAHIVTQHGGRIDVESRPGRGSLFRVVLPVQLGEETP